KHLLDGFLVGSLEQHRVDRLADSASGQLVVDVDSDPGLLGLRLEAPIESARHPAFEGAADSTRPLVHLDSELLAQIAPPDVVHHAHGITHPAPAPNT